MFNSTPFGFSNNCGPFGYTPSSCSPFNGFGGYSNYAPFSGWNSGSIGGYNSPSFDYNFNGNIGNGNIGNGNIGFGFPGYNFSNNWNTPFNGFNSSQGAFGGHHSNGWNSAPFSGHGYNNWNQFDFNGQFANPMSWCSPFSGTSQSAGFPSMNWNSAWMGSNSPLMNSGSYFPGNFQSQFTGASNWYNSPWMGYAHPGFMSQHNAVSNGKASAPVNGQFIPTGAFPFPCAPFNVPFPANGYVPAGQNVNCEAA